MNDKNSIVTFEDLVRYTEEIFVPLVGNIVEEKLIPIRQDIVEMKGDIVEMKGDIVEMKGDIVEMKGDIVEMKGDIVEMKEDIANIKVDIASIKYELSDVGQRLSRLEKSTREDLNAFGGDIIELREKAGLMRLDGVGV